MGTVARFSSSPAWLDAMPVRLEGLEVLMARKPAKPRKPRAKKPRKPAKPDPMSHLSPKQRTRAKFLQKHSAWYADEAKAGRINRAYGENVAANMRSELGMLMYKPEPPTAAERRQMDAEERRMGRLLRGAVRRGEDI